jgi:hypothetical protein
MSARSDRLAAAKTSARSNATQGSLPRHSTVEGKGKRSSTMGAKPLRMAFGQMSAGPRSDGATRNAPATRAERQEAAQCMMSEVPRLWATRATGRVARATYASSRATQAAR